MTHTLCIENLPGHAGDAELHRLLRAFGPLRCAAVVTDRDVLRRQPGIALVEMPTHRQARAAMAALDGMDYRGGTLRVRPAVTADFTRAGWICRWELPLREPPWRARREIAQATAGPRRRPAAAARGSIS